jgi:hypothetical protein
MKISIDGILGTARKINTLKESEEKNPEAKKSDAKGDSVSIGNRLTVRLDSIESELREIQSSLTRHQIIGDGIEQLRDDLQKRGNNQQGIVTGVTYRGEQVLRGIAGDGPVTEENLIAHQEKNNGFIHDEVSRLKKLQVELDNIMASDLVGASRLSGIVSNIDSMFSSLGTARIESISNIRAAAVMKLIK